MIERLVLQRTNYRPEPGQWKYVANGIAVLRCAECRRCFYVGGEAHPIDKDGEVKGPLRCPNRVGPECVQFWNTIKLVGWTGVD